MRSLLYCPGNKPGMLTYAGLYGADALVFDLEDSVSPDEKDEARDLVVGYLTNMDYGGAGRIVRINGLDTDFWRADLEAMVPLCPVVIRIPKMESMKEVSCIDEVVAKIEKGAGIPAGSTQLHLLLETPLGIEHAFELAGASKRVTALALGAEDYCRATGIDRVGEPYVLDYVRSRMVSAAGAYGIACYDSVWGVISDPEGLRRDARRARALGCTGKSVIHPDQIEIVNEIFSYTAEQIAWARRILEQAAYGATKIDGRMIDAPVIAQARRILDQSAAYSEDYE